MPTIWCTKGNCKILHLISQIFSDNQWRSEWERLVFGQFCFSIPFPLLTMLRNNEQNCVKRCYVLTKFWRWRGEILNTLFKFAIIFCHWLSEIYRKKKERWDVIIFFKKTQMCFNGPNNIMVHSVMRIKTANRAWACTNHHNNVFQLFLSIIC